MKSKPSPANNSIIEVVNCCAELVSFTGNISNLRGEFINVKHEFDHACSTLLDIQCQSKYVGGWETVSHPKIKAVIIGYQFFALLCSDYGFFVWMNPPISSHSKVRSNKIKPYHLRTGLVSFIANNGQLKG